jgi:hypothetical protein
MKLRLEPAALGEADDAREWYEAAREGLGRNSSTNSTEVFAK